MTKSFPLLQNRGRTGPYILIMLEIFKGLSNSVFRQPNNAKFFKKKKTQFF